MQMIRQQRACNLAVIPVLGLILAVALSLVAVVPAFAKTIEKEWTVEFTGTAMTDQGSADIVKELRGMQPGDSAKFTVVMYEKSDKSADWYMKNKVLEFVGPGVKELSCDYRIGIDVMTTETSCLTSIWETDETIRRYYENIGRPEDFKELKPQNGAYYDSVVKIDLSKVECMIALPFHPSIAYTVHELQANPEKIFAEVEAAANKQLGGKVTMDLRRNIVDGQITCDQGVIVGCSGGMYENIVEAARILEGGSIGNGYFDMSVYPSSTPISLAVTKNGTAAKLMEAGCVMKPAFCGPCFGAGDTPANQTLSIRHATRNFANREGSKPGNGQISAVALMDARSIAATAANKGYLTAATDMDVCYTNPKYHFDSKIYANRVFDSKGAADPAQEIKFGPNIKDWPAMSELPQNMVLKVVSEIHDPVTTTDELIPSGETSSYRSNPLGLAEFTLSRKDPAYVGRAKEIQKAQKAMEAGTCPVEAVEELRPVMEAVNQAFPEKGFGEKGEAGLLGFGSTIFAVKPGDGSAREQAASCQKVLGGWANIANEYATKRYRSNLINWGMLPFLISEGELPFSNEDYIFIPDIRKAVEERKTEILAYVVKEGKLQEFTLGMGELTEDERTIILKGCLINYYKG